MRPIGSDETCPFSSRQSSTRSFLALFSATALCLVVGCENGTEPESVSQSGSDPRNTRYVIENVPVELVNGVAEAPAAPGSSSKRITRIWGEPARADLNGDGLDDALLILTHSGGGSGTYYYLAAAIASRDGYSGTPGLRLGDRIEPRAIEVRGERASVRLMTRRPGESFADIPRFERTRNFVFAADSQQLVEVAHDFEGEADPDRMTLYMQTWTWVKTVYNDDSLVEPREKGAFTLTFEDGKVYGTTDCNRFNGAYSADDRIIRFDEKMMSTRKFCPNAQEMDFLQMLWNVQSYFFTSQGRLILELTYDSGSMHFR